MLELSLFFVLLLFLRTLLNCHSRSNNLSLPLGFQGKYKDNLVLSFQFLNLSNHFLNEIASTFGNSVHSNGDRLDFFLFVKETAS